MPLYPDGHKLSEAQYIFKNGDAVTWELQAGCKVNLYLDIVGVRADGYHELESLFYPLPHPHDTLLIEASRESGLHLTCSDPGLPGEGNILTRAYAGFARRTGFAPAIRVHLQKGIPQGAGLGGGSSDAAALLGWLNAQAGAQRLEQADLAALALCLGADVPFFLENVPAWVTGIGEMIQAVDLDLSTYTVVLVCPDVHVNTGWAYRKWDEVRGRKVLTPEKRPITSPSFTKPPRLWNAFEEVVFQEFPILGKLKADMAQYGAVGVVMSGSGSSLVALFDTLRPAADCAGALRNLGHMCYVLAGRA